jgi:uncharacterized hydrophobic protein (TIGR00271 family)
MNEESKFNFSEEELQQEINKDKAAKDQKDAIKQDARGLFLSLKTFLKDLLDFRHDTDRESTIAAIKGDIPFKGATAWILICSIFVASVGLNADSTAVVIGAMLISPLMGPILGIGLSVAVNDIDTLKKSLINFGVMIVLSVLTAFLFFWLFPLSEESSELLARTRPDIRDVLIAFFGGLALIIARTKKGTIASVIFGVAIATALMPPLCTVGYGLAVAAQDDLIRGLRFASGAMYLFIINTIFIALATFLTVKFLRFPMLKYANSKRRRFISRIATLLAILAMVPAGLTFVDVLRETNFEREAKDFIEKEVGSLDLKYFESIKRNSISKYIDKDDKFIEFNTYGLGEIPEITITLLKNKLKNYPNLTDAKLYFNQDGETGLDKFKYVEQLRARDSIDLIVKNNRIASLELEAKELSVLKRYTVQFDKLSQEAKINYENIDEMSYYTKVTTNFSKMDTLLVFDIKWKDGSNVSQESINTDMKRVEKWLKFKLDLDTLIVKRVR